MDADLQSLAERYAANRSSANREAVVLAGLPLVRSAVGRVGVPDHPLAAREDLESAGLLGLLQALDGFDPARGTAFASYAYSRIRGALVDYLRSIDALPRERRRRFAEAQKAAETLRQILGTEPEGQDVADYLGISLPEYHAILVDAQCRFSLSLNLSQEDEEESSPLDHVADHAAAEAYDRIERDSTMEALNRYIQTLPDREQTILGLYFYENLTLREIAGLLGLTEARISQILGKLLLSLRTRVRNLSGDHTPRRAA